MARRPRFRLGTLFVFVTLCALLSVVAGSWIRFSKRTTWTITSPGNLVICVRNQRWPVAHDTLEYVLFLPRGRSHLYGEGRSQEGLYEISAMVDGLAFHGVIDPTHEVWVASNGTFIPQPGDVDLTTLRGYLMNTPSESWTATGLFEYAMKKQ